MYEGSSNNYQKKHRNKFAIEVETVDGTVQTLYMFVSPAARVVDMLNDERQFLPFETADGAIVILGKASVRRVTPLLNVAPNASVRDPYSVLQVDPIAEDAEIHAAYRRAIANVHPDHIQSLGLPLEFLELATRRAAQINEAYGKIKRERRMAMDKAAEDQPA